MGLFRCSWSVIGLSGLFRSPWIPLGINVENRGSRNQRLGFAIRADNGRFCWDFRPRRKRDCAIRGRTWNSLGFTKGGAREKQGPWRVMI